MKTTNRYVLFCTFVVCTAIGTALGWYARANVRHGLTDAARRDMWQVATHAISEKVHAPTSFGGQGDHPAEHIELMGENQWLVSGWVSIGNKGPKEWLVGLTQRGGKWEVIGADFRDDLVEYALKEIGDQPK